MPSYLKLFTTLFNQLLFDLTIIFPKENNLKNYYMAVSNLIKVNPRLVLNYFVYYVYPYKELIINKNEEFFLGEDYYKDKLSKENSLIHATRLKKLWKNMDQEIKNKVWEYFINLIKLSELATNK